MDGPSLDSGLPPCSEHTEFTPGCHACNHRKLANKRAGKRKEGINVGVGMPAYLKLERFARELRAIFPDGQPYHVGSSLKGKTWRDVDVRLMLPDDVYEREFGPYVSPQYRSERWNALCCALSCWGSSLTGLPIDFQIQDHTRANAQNDGPRSALGIVPWLGVPDAE